MTEHSVGAERELSPLTNSLASCIRWRLSDYEAMLRGEMELLLGAAVLAEPRSGENEPQG